MNSDNTPRERVGRGTGKLTFIQTVPGAEVDVAAALWNFGSEKFGDSFVIMKTLGGFDIALLYPAPGFEPQVSVLGSIPGILKHTSFLCFPYGRSDKVLPTFNDVLKSLSIKRFAGFSLLKLHEYGRKRHDIQNEFFQCVRECFSTGECYCLGTVGWNEFILVIAMDDIHSIIRELTQNLLDERRSQCIIKSLSYLALKFDLLFGDQWFEAEKAAERAEDSNVIIIDPLLDTEMPRQIEPMVKISSKPSCYADIRKYWRENGFKTVDVLGEVDIMAVMTDPPPDYTWAELFRTLMAFRQKKQGDIHSTSTLLTYSSMTK